MTVTRFARMRRRPGAAAVAALLVLARAGLAGEARGQQAGAVDAKAMAILQAMSGHLAKAKTVSFRARTLFDEVRKSGIKIKSGRKVRVLLRRPDKLRAMSVGDNGAARGAWFDGARLTVWLRHSNRVMELPFAGGADGLLDALIEKHDVQLPLADLLYSDVAKAFEGSIVSAEHLGLRRVAGVQCHHLSFESTGADWQIWIQAGAAPLPRRFAISYVNSPEKPEFLAHLDRWILDAEAPDSHFRAAVPEGAEKIPFGKPPAE